MADKIQDFFNMHPDARDQMGVMALKSGAVSPEEVQAAQAHLQTPEGQDWLSKYIAPADKDPYFRGPAAATPPATGAKVPAGKKVSTKSFQPASSDAISQAADSYRNLPEFQAQQKALEDEQNHLNMQMAQPGPSGATWVKPLLALADSQTGSNLLSGYTEPETAAKRSERLMKAQNDLTKRKGDLSKELLGAIGKDKGTTTNIITGDTMGGRGLAAMLKLPSQAGKDFDTDKIIQAANQTDNSLHRADAILNGTMPLTTENINLAKADFINAMSPGGSATNFKMGKEMSKNFSEGLNLLQSYVDKPHDLRNTAQGQAAVKQLKGVIDEARRSIYEGGRKSVDAVHSRYVNVPDDNVQATIERKRQEYYDRFKLPDEKAPAGVKRTKELKDMTDAELAAYEKSLHGG